MVAAARRGKTRRQGPQGQFLPHPAGARQRGRATPATCGCAGRPSCTTLPSPPPSGSTKRVGWTFHGHEERGRPLGAGHLPQAEAAPQREDEVRAEAGAAAPAAHCPGEGNRDRLGPAPPAVRGGRRHGSPAHAVPRRHYQQGPRKGQERYLRQLRPGGAAS